ncbi:type III-A CRISPR-associated RAMP protein Csm4 [Caviibacterium pharyngocola]|uniref:CRISPR system Cms protein Csm4 n=1 Tax=Caviibacterium pharyngocola TaxID=28159 RepID=A0A2M8RU61_9PAST|nr:CRISPR-associated protein Csm4 [Caviibacterium pharyngocola]PJG82417.1 CRISPR-associated protein Csm4 [Caviibacterium pharyngocola]
MKTYRITLNIQSAFGTPLMGDTLFGQLCWAIVHRFGESRLNALLEGYDNQQPFAVVSDALPQNHLPLPTLPSRFWQEGGGKDRKKLKKKQWIEVKDTQQAVTLWQQSAKAEKEIFAKENREQPHNTLNRLTASTGKDEFAPYVMSQIWYKPSTLLDIYIVIDETRISLEEITALLTDIGTFGYGRDASIGLGKFSIEQTEAFDYTKANANAYLTLANCAPQDLGLNKERCFYQITTRFGRHGSLAVFSGNPFKKPIILTKLGAVFTPNKWEEKLFIGNGLTGVSYGQTNAVHQGYAPVIPLSIHFE